MDTMKDSPETPGRGIARDIQQLRVQGEASAAELRAFIAKTRGRSPQEVLGLVASSQLARSIALAAVGAVVVLAVGSVVPWMLSRATLADKPSARSASVTPGKNENERNLETTTSPPAPASSTTAAANPQPRPADAEKAVRVMGLGDTKAADPNSNPLEKNLDNLLDNLE